MSCTEQMRLYHATRAIAQTQKIAFLQSSAESPGILMLLQELFYSSMDSLSPGETILELHKTSAAKGLTEAILKFFKYVVLFYHNCGNYDLITGVKILPEVARYDLKEIISSSRIATKSASSKTSSSKKEAELVEFKPTQCYPFYGAGVTFVDSVRVNRTLEAHGICKRNTRILKKRDVSGGSILYTVVQPSVTAISEPIGVLPAHSSGKVRVYRGDFSHFLEKMIGSLQKSSDSEASKRVVESIAQVFADADETSLSSAFSTWKGTQDDVLDIFVDFFPVPKHRDPTGTRCAIESYVAVQNRVYQARLTRIIEHHVDDFVRFLPFHRLMRPHELLGQMTIQCVDLVATGRSRTVLPLNMPPQAADPVIPGPHKVLYIVNTTENYVRGVWSHEKREQLDAFFLPNDIELIDAARDQVHFLRFILEEVLSPTTTVFLTGMSNNQPSFDEFTAAYLPAELYIETSDEEDIAIEDDSDPEWFSYDFFIFRPIPSGRRQRTMESEVMEVDSVGGVDVHAPTLYPPQNPLQGSSECTVYVGSVHSSTTREELHALFASCGLILRISIPHDRGTGLPRGFAFVDFGTPDAAIRAVSISRTEIHGQAIEVRVIKRQEHEVRSSPVLQAPVVNHEPPDGQYGWKVFRGDQQSATRDVVAFLEQYRPSMWSERALAWICVQHLSEQSRQDEDIDGLVQEWEAICARPHPPPQASDVHLLSQKYRVLSGKWMVFCPREDVDRVWSSVVWALLSGHLGAVAKVSPVSLDPRNRNHVICVYADDYTNQNEVNRIRHGLTQIGLVKPLQFKPDAYTECGIYSKNPWGIPATMYSK
ncbi:hypothetical protein Poli38472_001172 [Pythium oligandrum]|uniref:RRM domain-containing protein n=1 Tax=Pythium oligandrum TaxID=41045 RepID=A0A8K1FN52_PYTOL|nr:hypothetical protein Poli38472_001172 [Pythium oligandrum]|eukprot:TMW69016.1 hypothetical protein Poli38472_001172 [Pythium oligandrum]